MTKIPEPGKEKAYNGRTVSYEEAETTVGWPKSRDLLSNDAGQEDMLRPTGLPISRASVNGRTVQPRAASFTARQIETISTIKVLVREENSQCNFQAVDAQRFLERKTQGRKRAMMAHSVWMNGVQATN